MTERMQFLAAVADLYYVKKKSQAEIARIVGYSRSGISRLLAEAEEKGVLEIRINYPLLRNVEMELQLQDSYGVSEAIVIERGNMDYQQMLRTIGRQAATYLAEHIRDHQTIGISWGTALYEMATSLTRQRLRGLRIVQMIGGVGHGNPNIDGPELAIAFAQALGGDAVTLNAPHVVRSADVCDVLLQEPHIRRVLEVALNADMAFVGIGSTSPDRSSLLRAGYMNEDELLTIRARGAVGDICGRQFDEQGQVLDIEINRRVVGLDIRRLRTRPCRVVGVAGGRQKASAIKGALRGKHIDVIVTDSNAASWLIAESELKGEETEWLKLS